MASTPRGGDATHVKYEAIEQRLLLSGYSSAVFDFGGTLIDFLPLHQEAFVEAFGFSPDGPSSNVVRKQIADAILTGEDSFAMASRVKAALDSSENIMQVVEQKRRIVERLLRGRTLQPEATVILSRLLAHMELSVISLGLVSSMEEVIAGSLPYELASKIRIYGRRSFTEKISKLTVLSNACSDSSAPKKSICYIGDAAVDAESARRVGIDFVSFAPFLY